VSPAAASSPSPGFAQLDERVAQGAGGIVLARGTSRETAEALREHLVRRARACGRYVVEARARRGSPLFSEVARHLAVETIPTDVVDAADVIARAAVAQRATIVATLPSRGGWDRAVMGEMALRLPESVPLVVVVTHAADGADDVTAEAYDVGAVLNADELQRWWDVLSVSAQACIDAESIASLEGWWSRAQSLSSGPVCTEIARTAAGEEALARVALASCSWPLADLSALGVDGGVVQPLVREGALCVCGGRTAVAPPWESHTEGLARAASPVVVREIAGALLARGTKDSDPWLQMRAAELLLRTGDVAASEQAHASALSCAEDPLGRSELILRWTDAIGALPRDAQLPLRSRAAERALAAGEAEEAYRLAQGAAAMAPTDPEVALLFGRAATGWGDLVAAKMALERAAAQATSPGVCAAVATELAELAYLGGDLPAADDHARRALSLVPAGEAPATHLKARNTLGKLLLADSAWDEADHHFAHDAWTAAAAGLRTEELRARVNRGIALLSKGLLDEAHALFEGVLAEGERERSPRLVAFALDNMCVVATLRHDYSRALALAERTMTLRRRLGDRLATALVLSNLAELRRRLGLLDHAEHAVLFGRRTLGPPTRSALFSLQAARNALLRGQLADARREANQAVAETEAWGSRKYVCEAYRVATRVALEDGELARAADLLGRLRALAPAGDANAEVTILSAKYARACGQPSGEAAALALSAARAAGNEDLIIEAHTLISEIDRSSGCMDSARAHVAQAMALRDQVAGTLQGNVRAAFLGRPDLVGLAALHRDLAAHSPAPSDPPPSGPRATRSEPQIGSSSLPRELVGDDPAVRALLGAIRKVARSASTVLIRGESGTGKELVAEAIHRASDRASGPLVTVNCAALVETLLLSELFGHEKGAFTGAIARRRGRFEVAEGGTLFLDEIGDISPRTQVALLRVLQERTFERVGGAVSLRANVRVVCATHRDLKAMVERGEFREDLYYRLRGVTLEVPPLRARLGDLARISNHLLARIAAERGEAKKSLTRDALTLLERHTWPGNVRELENALRVAALFAEGETIGASVFLENVDDVRIAVQARAAAAPAVPASASAEHGEQGCGRAAGDEPGAARPPVSGAHTSSAVIAYGEVREGALSLPNLKRQIERECIARALAETSGNISRAATLLGMKRPRLSQLVKQYGLAAVLSEE
jgi:DNA-binding NtrC family response regulator/tetratricopeptide (TPR) repeat protein